MPIDATTIYNRAGTVHTWYWDKRVLTGSKSIMRSLCGLSELYQNLDTVQGTSRCKKCEAKK